MVTASVAFLLNLLLIFIARRFDDPAPAFLAHVNRNYLSAIYTPFSFILFYEVLMLVAALPRSMTVAVGKQYEIISLIAVRGVFKDIGHFESLEEWTRDTETIRELLVDLAGAAGMFGLVAVFHLLRRRTRPEDAPGGLDSFIAFKKAVAIVLTVVFVGLAVFSLGDWARSLVLRATGRVDAAIDVELIFFPRFFEIMIFADVLILIVSFAISKGYHFVFRNAGFVISTILLRLSLTADKPWDVAAAVTAMIFGLVVLAIFNGFVALSRRPEPAGLGHDRPDPDPVAPRPDDTEAMDEN